MGPYNQQSGYDRAGQQTHPKVLPRGKCRITSNRPQQSCACAGRAEGEVQLLARTPGDSQEIAQNQTDDEIHDSEDNTAGYSRRSGQDSTEATGDGEIANRQRQKRGSMNQGHEGALAVGQNGECGHPSRL